MWLPAKVLRWLDFLESVNCCGIVDSMASSELSSMAQVGDLLRLLPCTFSCELAELRRIARPRGGRALGIVQCRWCSWLFLAVCCVCCDRS